jgi:formate dehydrogenase subunit gamma
MDPVQAAVDRILAFTGSTPADLLPVLHTLQRELGHIPAEAVAPVARALGLSRADVQGVIRFYDHFRETPPGRHTLRLCRAEACQAVGAAALANAARERLGCSFHETSADGAVSLEPVHCLGQCATGPALMVDDRELHARVSPEALDELIDRLRSAP